MVRHPWRPGIELRPIKVLEAIAGALHALGLVLAGVGKVGDARWSVAGERLQQAAELLKAR